MLERRDIVGGAAVTEEFHPGFRNSTASYTVSLLRPKVIADMRLHERGWRDHRAADLQLPPAATTAISSSAAGRRARRPSSRASRQKDADAFPHMTTRWNASPTCCATWRCKTPPNAGGGLRALLAAARAGPAARRA